MTYSGVVVIRISQPRRHDLELQLSWDHQSQPHSCPPPPRCCNTSPLVPGDALFSCSLWMIVPYPTTDLTSRTDGDSEHYRSCWRILIRPSWWWRYRSVGGEWFVKPTIFFSLFSVGARQFWVAQRSLGFSLGLSCCMVGHDWGIPYPIHFILIEDQVRIYVMHFSTRYCG